jgi:hypothetical protein
VARVTPSTPTQTGSFRLRLIHVPPDVTGQIAPDGPPVTIANTVPGQNMRLSFTGTKGQRVSLSETAIAVKDDAGITILDPAGNRLSGEIVLPGTAFSDTTELPVDGTYTVLIDPDQEDVGSVTIAMHDVPPDVVVRTEPNAKPFTITTTVPGQNASFSFPARAGQRLSMNMTGITVPTSVGVELDAPDGSRVAGQIMIQPGGFLDTQTLPQSGTYTMKIDPADDGTGSVTVALFAVPPDPVVGLSVNGPVQTATTVAPGQNVVLEIKGGSGAITLHCTGVSFPQGLVLQALDAKGQPTGALQFVGSNGGDVPFEIGSSGLLVVRLDASEADVGHVTVSVQSA